MNRYCPTCHTNFDNPTWMVCPHDGTLLEEIGEGSQGKRDRLIGSVIDGRYRILELLGEGGMGAVYLAKQLAMDRNIAVKIMHRGRSEGDDHVQRFFREARILASLTHPNIVRVIDFGEDLDREMLYLIMEYIEGHNLDDLLHLGRITPPLALDLVYQICGALTEPHAQGVVHRDLKPDNLLLLPISDGTLQVKVVDFGIARSHSTTQQLTASGLVCGTPAYMSPEQAQDHEVDVRSDLYSLGVILYQMLSGCVPFDDSTQMRVVLKHIQEEPPTFNEVLPEAEFPASIVELVFSLLAKEPSRRPKDSNDLRERIEAIQDELGYRRIKLRLNRNWPECFGEFLIPHSLTKGSERSAATVGFDDPEDSSDSPRDFEVNAEQETSSLALGATSDAHSLPAEHPSADSSRDEIQDSYTSLGEPNSRGTLPIGLLAQNSKSGSLSKSDEELSSSQDPSSHEGNSSSASASGTAGRSKQTLIGPHVVWPDAHKPQEPRPHTSTDESRIVNSDTEEMTRYDKKHQAESTGGTDREQAGKVARQHKAAPDLVAGQTPEEFGQEHASAAQRSSDYYTSDSGSVRVDTSLWKPKDRLRSTGETGEAQRAPPQESMNHTRVRPIYKSGGLGRSLLYAALSALVVLGVGSIIIVKPWEDKPGDAHSEVSTPVQVANPSRDEASTTNQELDSVPTESGSGQQAQDEEGEHKQPSLLDPRDLDPNEPSVLNTDSNSDTEDTVVETTASEQLDSEKTNPGGRREVKDQRSKDKTPGLGRAKTKEDLPTKDKTSGLGRAKTKEDLPKQKSDSKSSQEAKSAPSDDEQTVDPSLKRNLDWLKRR